MSRVDKSMLAFGIPHRIVDKLYRLFMSKQPCIACDAKDGTVVGAHLRWGNEGGMGLKPSDELMASLCFECHADQEDNPGPGWWVEHVLKPMMRTNYEIWKMG